jgi:hypothetical protein
VFKRPPRIESYNYKTEQRKIMNDNLSFMHKLMKKKSGINVDALREKRSQEESLLKNICQFPHILGKKP